MQSKLVFITVPTQHPTLYPYYTRSQTQLQHSPKKHNTRVRPYTAQYVQYTHAQRGRTACPIGGLSTSCSQVKSSLLYCQFFHMYSTYIQRIEIALLSDPWCIQLTLNTDSRHSNTDKYSLTMYTSLSLFQLFVQSLLKVFKYISKYLILVNTKESTLITN